MFIVIQRSKESGERAILFLKVSSNFVEKTNASEQYLVGDSFVWKKNDQHASARFRACAPLDPAMRSHRVYFSNVIHNSSIFYPKNLNFCSLCFFFFSFPTLKFDVWRYRLDNTCTRFRAFDGSAFRSLNDLILEMLLKNGLSENS